ncbi:probable dolichyl pyrophosphate Glc1Man9GlcNAc2 alpha-1,3-glucosyltransferase isoform X1 [Ischnura elegans]|uniref:probable dolichyl pyrophosphate Glc1Man9GlcNAc2 alpha-1,3-glucosyltransferase isoform X1 n=2 Tax=Ischnura elegans TaxID=197161 RepID=UPI001ED86BFE|nr:probable dolichyl pyrophosphate Glc1Man9GlcNAc2 alpha-1,3-glucosyltransferase isoform X1 [Ischnura elegans]
MMPPLHFCVAVIIFSCLKALFIPAYRSTDFEVHRNWLAITYSLPISKWYFEDTSEWTLDYPPLFAWFEYGLSHIASFFDPKMLDIKRLNYDSWQTVYFQRFSVILTDLVYAYGAYECCKYLMKSSLRKSSKWGSQWASPSAVLALLLLGNAGLLMVDHIHFQYNGFLFGIMLISLSRMLQDQYLASSFWFAVLLNLKHIFLYVSPVYFIYLLRNYCFQKRYPGTPFKPWFLQSLRQLVKLGLVVGLVFLVSFGPFIAMGEIKQVFSRLFPFKRGLSHAYWAPNFWALYNAADKAILVIGKKAGYFQSANFSAAMTGGLVQEYEHSVLPSIMPRTTFIFVFLSILPALLKLFMAPKNPLHFVRCLVLCAFGSFMFGWHVHEKAVLLMIVPLSLLAVVWKKEAEVYLLLATVGHYSLFPLLFTTFEIPLKALLLVMHSMYSYISLSNLFHIPRKLSLVPFVSRLESLYLMGLLPLFLYENIFHVLMGFDKRYPFLPLMMTSSYCAIGITYCWLKYYWHFVTMSEVIHKRKAY